MGYQAFKNRKIDLDKKVEIYKNLHNGLFSVRQNGLVVAHVEDFKLKNVSFKVLESGRKKVLRELKKNVHAFIVGHIVSLNEGIKGDNKKGISYNPYKSGNFHFKDDKEMMPIKLHDFEIVEGDSKKGIFLF